MKVSETIDGSVNTKMAQESSTETEVRDDSNDLSSKGSEGTINMERVEESSNDQDIHNNLKDTRTKEYQGKREVNSCVVNVPPLEKKKTLVKMVDIGQNLDCSGYESESKDECDLGTIKQKIEEQKNRKTLVNYTESSDSSDECPKNVESDMNTGSPNYKDPLIGGKLQQDVQTSSDCEEQAAISLKLAKVKGKYAEKKLRNSSLVTKRTGQLPLWMR